MTVKELRDAMDDCLFQVEQYDKDTDDYIIVCDPFTPIPKEIGEKKVIVATPSIGYDMNGMEHTIITMQI